MSQTGKIIILLVGFVVFAAALWFVVFRSPSEGRDVSVRDREDIVNELVENVVQQGDGSNSRETEVVNLQPLGEEALAQGELEQLAVLFIGRWGTYSNQDSSKDVSSLEQYMTSRMRDFSDGYLVSVREFHPYQEGYYGVTTQVASVDLGGFSLSSQSVTATVSTRREERMEPSGTVRVYNQDAEVRFVKQGDTWLVDAVYWR